jgi:hypothetical protein
MTTYQGVAKITLTDSIAAKTWADRGTGRTNGHRASYGHAVA